MADLLLKERIEVQTSHGQCEINLNFGSITKLKKEDAVDILVVSAFPGLHSYRYSFMFVTFRKT